MTTQVRTQRVGARGGRGIALLGAVALNACGGSHGAAVNSRFPPRPDGCPVEIFHDAPMGNTENIGPVYASCDETLTDVECQQSLRDQVCRMGGDIVWGVEVDPTRGDGRKAWHGRAAHSLSPLDAGATSR